MPVPVNWRTGEVISEGQRTRTTEILRAWTELLTAMHFADGTAADAERFGSRVMAIAATQIEIGVEMALKAAMETK